MKPAPRHAGRRARALRRVPRLVRRCAARALRPAVTATALVLMMGACSGESPPPGSLPGAEVARLRDELAASIRDELRAELRPVVLDELRRELANKDAGATAEPPVRTAAEPDASPPDASQPSGDTAQPTADASQPTESDAAELPGGELWNRPGTTIWPTRGGLRLVELTVGTGLDEKLPIGIQSHYPAIPEILYCYTVFENPDPEQTVAHVWRRNGRLVSKVELEVGQSSAFTSSR
jgi:hypothetical protein